MVLVALICQIPKSAMILPVLSTASKARGMSGAHVTFLADLANNPALVTSPSLPTVVLRVIPDLTSVLATNSLALRIV